jgi:hypothetical protein
MMPRRQFLTAASAMLVNAAGIVRAAGRMPVRSIIAPIQQDRYDGFVDRLRVDSLYRSGKLQGAALARAIEHGLLDHVLARPAV